jgi:fibronectin type 3 domain-containing protein
MRKVFTCVFLFITILINAQTSRDVTIDLTATANTAGPNIQLKWKADPNASHFTVFKKQKDANAWDSLVKLPNTASTFTDASVTIGTCYEYMVVKRSTTLPAVSYILAGVKRDLPSTRGKLILLVDKNYAAPLAAEITQLQNDLFGDGWLVIRHDVNRADAVTAVKQLVLNDYNADPQSVKAVYILGHVPVPYSAGFSVNSSISQYYPPDGHPDHSGAWPADMYYGTMNEDIWTDNSFDDMSGARVQNQNKPGDGKFDIPYIYNDTVTLEVGRVDLFNMPSFSNNDTMLVKRYLTKAHNFKMGINVGARKGYICDNFGYLNGEAFASSGWRAFTPMFGDSIEEIPGGSFFSTLKTKSSQFAYGCGGGSFTSCGGVGVTTNYVTDSTLYNFGMMFGSYFGDWDAQDNFLRAPLASKGWGLSNSWSGRPYHYYHPMAMGENLGYCMRESQNNFTKYVYNIYPTFIHTALMGDPSLRMNPVLPPANVALSTSTDEKTVTVKWNKSKDPGVISYYVYRAKSRTSPINYRGTVPATDSIFTDNGPSNGLNYYFVKAVKLETTASGTYLNTSIGMFDTITAVNAVGIAQSQEKEFTIYPNPAQNVLHIAGNNSGKEYSIDIFDINGRIMQTETWKDNGAELQLNISRLIPGVYFVKIECGDDVNVVEKVVRVE